MTRLYIINDYEEHGPETIRVGTSKDAARRIVRERLDQDWTVEKWKGNAEYRATCLKRLEELLAADEPCSRDLGDGWGGLQLHIVNAEE